MMGSGRKRRISWKYALAYIGLSIIALIAGIAAVFAISAISVEPAIFLSTGAVIYLLLYSLLVVWLHRRTMKPGIAAFDQDLGNIGVGDQGEQLADGAQPEDIRSTLGGVRRGVAHSVARASIRREPPHCSTGLSLARRSGEPLGPAARPVPRQQKARQLMISTAWRSSWMEVRRYFLICSPV